jgi:hypothetical protein
LLDTIVLIPTVPIIGTAFIGVGNLTAMMTIQTYLVDAFTVHAASAIAANTVLRSVFGAVLPLAGLDMCKSSPLAILICDLY